ncbi:type IIL restriction-modification enzyme MmeI [Treponema denticola]|uniref:type IIL restriction-modification enzyme MmeI n=1 Tax=Treponema denticola TaxID=158 RepID=UPI003D6E42CE
MINHQCRLNDPDTMPSVLVKAHAALDSAVDKLYRKTAFSDDAARTAHLFELYLKKTEGVLAGKRGR